MAVSDRIVTLVNVTTRITKEIEQFRIQQMAKGGAELYDDWYEICVKEELFDFLLNADLGDYEYTIFKWLEPKESPLEFLYQRVLDSEYGFTHQWDLILDWIVIEMQITK